MTSLPFSHTYAELPSAFFSEVAPAGASDPTSIRVNSNLAQILKLDAGWLRSADGVAMLSGQAVPEQAHPIAMAYAGHQFGGWSPQLGDGRALLLGELIGTDGVRRDLQLKGSGRTPYSRGGDGKAALGPVMREYIVSEAMYAYGVPTTRALAATLTGDLVQREAAQPGAVLARVAQSHIRVGTFQYFFAREDNENLRVLADYVIERHYPDIAASDDPYIALLKAVMQRQADLIPMWMSLGFIHGVMNTDNMQVVGETIDFGPCAFMDDFHSKKVFSSIDRDGRYAWINQPNMAQWDLTRLAEAFLPLIDADRDVAIEKAQNVMTAFGPMINTKIIDQFVMKLGLMDDQAEDAQFVGTTFLTMTEQKTDFTLFFRRLTEIAAGQDQGDFLALFENPDAGAAWLEGWRKRISSDKASQADRVTSMQKQNPIYIPRNHRIEEAIQAGVGGDFTLFHRLVDVLKNPYTDQEEFAAYEHPPTPENEIQQTFCGT